MNDDYPSWVEPYLAALEEMGLPYSAAVAARTTVRAVDALRRENSEFDYAVVEALERSNDVLEKEARRRAVEGIDKGIYYQGELVNTETQYSDSLLTTLIKAKRPDEFADRKQISGAGGAPLTVLVRSFGQPTNDLTIKPAGAHLPVIEAEFHQVAPELADVLAMV